MRANSVDALWEMHSGVLRCANKTALGDNSKRAGDNRSKKERLFAVIEQAAAMAPDWIGSPLGNSLPLGAVVGPMMASLMTPLKISAVDSPVSGLVKKRLKTGFIDFG